jgi:hypothetical protein
MTTLTKFFHRDLTLEKIEKKNFATFWKIDSNEIIEFHEIIRRIVSGEFNIEKLNSFEDLQFIQDNDRLELVFLLNSLSFKLYKDYFYSPYNKGVTLKELLKHFCTEYYYSNG